MTRATFLPYALPSIGEDEIAEVVDSLRAGWITTGPKVRRFEADFAAYVGTRHAVAVNSCTAGLHLALAALGIGPGDEVIVPTLTFCSTAHVVVHLGARPVLVDVGDDFNVTPEAVERAVTPRTRAVIPVHFGGLACDLAAIYRIAARHGLAVVEDAAHAVGSTYAGRLLGADALPATALAGAAAPRVVTAFSFYATKNLTTGEGGMVTTADPALADRVRLLALHGMSRDAWQRYTQAGSWYYEVTAAGYKENMTDIQAALGIHQLRRIEEFTAARQALARRFDAAFGDVPEVAVPRTHADRRHVYHLYVLRLDLARLAIDRAQFIDELRHRNIGSSVHFIPVHLHRYYQQSLGCRRGDFPRAEALYDCIVSLPLYPRMTDRDADDVVEAVRDIVAAHRRPDR